MADDKGIISTVGGIDMDRMMLDDEKYHNEVDGDGDYYGEEKRAEDHLEWQNNSNSVAVPDHRRISMMTMVSEGPKHKRKAKEKVLSMSITIDNNTLFCINDEEEIQNQRSLTPGGDIDELRDNKNIQEDEFIVQGDDEDHIDKEKLYMETDYGIDDE